MRLKGVSRGQEALRADAVPESINDPLKVVYSSFHIITIVNITETELKSLFYRTNHHILASEHGNESTEKRT